MKALLLFIILFSSAYGIEECSVNENFVVNDYKDVKKILEKVPANKFSIQFCQSMSVCYGEKSSKATCDFFEGFYEEALISLEKRKFGTCGMSKEELTLLKYYTTAGFTCLNSHLRGLKTNPNINYLVEVMENAINKLPAYRGLVRRGAGLPDSEREKYFEGNTVSDKAFMSSSTFQGFAFNKDQMIIMSRTGRMVMTVNDGSENEVVFRPDTKFKVLKAKSVKDRNFYIMKEIVEGVEDDISDEKLLEMVKNLPEKQDFFTTDRWTCPQGLKASIPKEIKQKTTPDLVGFEK